MQRIVGKLNHRRGLDTRVFYVHDGDVCVAHPVFCIYISAKAMYIVFLHLLAILTYPVLAGRWPGSHHYANKVASVQSF